jgi:hypothetical protein
MENDYLLQFVQDMQAYKYYGLNKKEYSEEETIKYIDEVMEIWFEQKIIRAVCRD